MAPRRADPTKRDAIFDAALELFVERGFHGTTMPDLAGLAGVGAGTIYRHFESKDAIVNELYRSWKGQLATFLLDDFPFDAPPRAQFREYWTRYMRFAKAHPRAQAFLELHHHADYLDDESRALEESLQETARRVVLAMQGAHSIKNLAPELVMAFVLGALVGLVRAAWHDHLELTDEVIAQSEQCCWEAIRA